MQILHFLRSGAMVLSLALLAPSASAQGDDPLTREPYLGVTVRDSEHGPVVSWIGPGPLRGTGYSAPNGLRRSDNIVGINGNIIESAAHFNAIVQGLRPGDIVHLQVRRSPDATPTSAVPRGGPGGEELMFTAQLSDRLTWSGTIGRARPEGADLPKPSPGEFRRMILREAEGVGIVSAQGGVNDLLAHLRDVQIKARDPNSLPAVLKAFAGPLSLDSVEQEIGSLVSGAGESPWGLIAGVLDLPAIAAERGAVEAGERAVALARVRAESRRWAPAARELVRSMRRGVNLDGNVEGSLALIRESPRLVEAVLPALAQEGRARWAELRTMSGGFAGRPPMADVPAEVRGAVEGDILHAERREGAAGGWLVIGGGGANTYDMSKLAFVIDIGGDDVYHYGASPAEHLVQIVIDLDGNDTHESRVDFAGPATAVFGVSILDDARGNDTYRSVGGPTGSGDVAAAEDRGTHFVIGAGLFGFGILVDRAGEDRYLNTGPDSGWSTGAGYYGAGLIIDHGGADEYHAELLSQGVGGPRGFGAIIDRAGDDRYKANGPNFASAYGTEGVYRCFSQGVGYGVRSYAAGGVGAIYDMAGKDRYEAGEFGQAGAYYFGLGVLHDFAGNDEYRGNRYGQAFAAHQAAGILIDDEGDDRYWSMTAASQSGAWDQSITMLIDRAGNDVYEADGLAQGAAAMQAIALLIDVAGDDVYRGQGGSVQGAGGNNTYHFDAAGVYSFSGLFDLAGRDEYSSGRQNGAREATGVLRKERLGESTVHGVFVDRE